MSLPVPTWSLQQYNASVDAAYSVPPRWGSGVAFLPNGAGLNAADTGLTALIFGGYNSGAYLGDVVSYNFGNGAMRTLVASQAAASDTQPFARGYTEWSQLLAGAGANSAALINLNVDSGRMYMMGGSGQHRLRGYGAECARRMRVRQRRGGHSLIDHLSPSTSACVSMTGTSDGVKNGAFDADYNDEWYVTAAGRASARLHSSASHIGGHRCRAADAHACLPHAFSSTGRSTSTALHGCALPRRRAYSTRR
jgi:hypothetical protein